MWSRGPCVVWLHRSAQRCLRRSCWSAGNPRRFRTSAVWPPLASVAWSHYSSVMSVPPDRKPVQTRFDPPYEKIKARQMGELERGSSRWDVLLETAVDSDLGATRGRIHFVSGNVHRLSAWIFLEPSQQEVEQRFFTGFPAQELWNLLKALGGE